MSMYAKCNEDEIVEMSDFFWHLCEKIGGCPKMARTGVHVKQCVHEHRSQNSHCCNGECLKFDVFLSVNDVMANNG